jgi:hypothetical protein
MLLLNVGIDQQFKDVRLHRQIGFPIQFVALLRWEIAIMVLREKTPERWAWIFFIRVHKLNLLSSPPEVTLVNVSVIKSTCILVFESKPKLAGTFSMLWYSLHQLYNTLE